MRLKNRKREMFAVEMAAMTPLDRAYVAAGYSDTPWARYNASKLAHTPEVAARIAELQEDFRERSAINAAYIQRKLLPLIESNVADLYEPVFDAEGKCTGERLKAITNLPRNLASAITKIKHDPETGAVIEVTLAGKTEAGTVLLRSIGGLVDRNELTGKDGGPVETRYSDEHTAKALASFIARTNIEDRQRQFEEPDSSKALVEPRKG